MYIEDEINDFIINPIKRLKGYAFVTCTPES